MAASPSREGSPLFCGAKALGVTSATSVTLAGAHVGVDGLRTVHVSSPCALLLQVQGGSALGTGRFLVNDDVLWVRGVDYLGPWCEARTAAETVNVAIHQVGLHEDELMAFAGTGAGGEPLVRLRGTPVGVTRAAWLMRLGAGSLSARRQGWVKRPPGGTF